VFTYARVHEHIPSSRPTDVNTLMLMSHMAHNQPHVGVVLRRPLDRLLDSVIVALICGHDIFSDVPSVA